MMVDDHKEDVNLFKDASQNSNIDPAVMQFAAKTLPTLQKHLDRINAIDKQMR